MTEGGIASWKKKEGESFAAGDVLLEIVSRVDSQFRERPIISRATGNRQGYHRR